MMLGTLHIAGPLELLAEIAADLAAKYPEGVTARVSVPEVEGWTAERARVLLDRVAPRQRTLLTVLATAGVEVSDDVIRAELGNATGSLTGLTGPLKKHFLNLKAEGVVPADATQPWLTLYDDTNPSYQRTRGMRMPSEIVSVFQQALGL